MDLEVAQEAQGSKNKNRKSAIKCHKDSQDHKEAEKLKLSKLATERLVEKLNDKFINEKLHTPDISDKSFSYSNEITGNDMLAALSEKKYGMNFQ
ncbi:7970_t:CDS:2, partial [Entrophospora sp. SA101]